ncbi:allergen Asp F4-like protein [Purpureocillium lavendulum]|uniref:Allergen Asp F4-like protein n=1 Tax=Purpureocillium lavendulum TaxID=1247861 RepID=A0AB34FUK5_9HYPO|nr:allergen Asp F4-like protein [Purpureocillium lavendulum]
MKVSAATVVLATALGVAAHPSGAVHHHMHKRMEFVKAGVPQPPPQPAQSTSGGSGAGAKTYKPFCGGSNSKRATAAEIAYKGNVGGTGDQYGCNMMIVSNDIVDKYPYAAIFENKSGKDQKCVCWNKIGPKDLIDGFFASANPGALKFELPAAAKQAVVFDQNTQGGCTCGGPEIPITKNGMFGNTWVEYDFGNESNKQWSGADASCLAAVDEGMPASALTVCGGPENTCSIINADGTGTNAFVKGTNAMDGLGLNIQGKTLHLAVTIG